MTEIRIDALESERGRPAQYPQDYLEFKAAHRTGAKQPKRTTPKPLSAKKPNRALANPSDSNRSKPKPRTR